MAPRSIALIGSGAWTDAVATGNDALGYRGILWRVHPTRASTARTPYYRAISDLPGEPDAAFIAVPNHEAPAVAGALAARGCGGFVCFTAGFSETGSASGQRLSEELAREAGSLPFLGPNCYGFVNFFDRAALLPDQVAGPPVERGVALICQSGTIALTLMFNQRSLPIGYLLTVGNQTRLAVEDLIEVLCEDPRVSAFGLYIEGIKDAPSFARAADKARAAGKPIAVVKSGRTAAAVRTARSHTGALAGEDSVFEAFCRQAGLARCDTLGTLCETLKVFHLGGALPGRKILIMGASGGDMAMAADVSRALPLDFASIPEAPAAALRTLLTDRVTVANPFDLHTYLWFDPPALGRVFAAALRSGYDLIAFMLDCPPAHKDGSSFDAVIDVFIAAAGAAAAQGVPSRAALIASLPETLGAATRERCLAGAVIPLQGLREALEALSLAGEVGAAWRSGSVATLRLPPGPTAAAVRTLGETEGKLALAAFGVPVPRGCSVAAALAAETAASLGFPVVMKAVSGRLEHKTEAGGVILDVRSKAEGVAAGERLAALADTVLVEEMITNGVAEMLVGVIVDRQFGQVLVLGAGGVLAELLSDCVSLLPPWTRETIAQGLGRLAAKKLLDGYRGSRPGDITALIDAILDVARFAAANLDALVELDVNPMIVRPAGQGVVAVDALVRLHISI